MAAMSAASASTATFPQQMEHEVDSQWDYSSHNAQAPAQNKAASIKSEFANKTNGAISMASNPTDYGFDPLPPAKKKVSTDSMSTSMKNTRSWDRKNTSVDASIKSASSEDVFSGPSKRPAHGTRRTKPDNIVEEWDDENSKWIHRDKLAKIESKELQAAGIFIPRSRASSKARRGRSEERAHGAKRTTSTTREEPELSVEPPVSRQRMNSNAPNNHTPPNGDEVPSWDLRLPEEIEAEGDGYWISNDASPGGSKIPVAKLSPAPIPEHFLDRHSPSSRKQSDMSLEADSIAYPKASRSRSGSINGLTSNSAPALTLPTKQRSATADLSPKKSPAGRKQSLSGKPVGRPKTRNGAKDSSSSTGTARPHTRSGEFSPIKQPEGDPPWNVGSYKPDPRLPPDQQLLPTVARRLQQERMEKEGKFGSVYDREFRPLNDEPLQNPPDAATTSKQHNEESEKQGVGEWPLRPESRPNMSKQGASYSTIPRISDMPPANTMPAPRSPPTAPEVPAESQTITRIEGPEHMDTESQKEKRKGGCGCCIVM